MPASYAHYNFGMKVYSALKGDALDIIGNYIDLYNIGLYGPDILFYYRPYIRNSVNKLGMDIHAQRADNFFIRSKNIITHSENYKASLAYTLGFICHFILDSRCHPYVNRKISESGIVHSKIETEFDKELIRFDGKDIKDIILTKPIKVNDSNIKTVSPFFSLPYCKVKESLMSMKFYSSMFVELSGIKMNVLSKILKMSRYYDEVIGAFYSETDEPLLKDSNNILHELLNESVEPAVKTINEYLDTICSSRMPAAFNRCFD